MKKNGKSIAVIIFYLAWRIYFKYQVESLKKSESMIILVLVGFWARLMYLDVIFGEREPDDNISR